ncbi:hypothetical protein R1sor_022793 [Riccia sorocarpa]|uniref:Uncharacterized protein n=1 Tax=Riccia sorocarpa TaxID=122646 RepID=A0ABD3GNW3_9MARC
MENLRYQKQRAQDWEPGGRHPHLRPQVGSKGVKLFPVLAGCKEADMKSNIKLLGKAGISQLKDLNADTLGKQERLETKGGDNRFVRDAEGPISFLTWWWKNVGLDLVSSTVSLAAHELWSWRKAERTFLGWDLAAAEWKYLLGKETHYHNKLNIAKEVAASINSADRSAQAAIGLAYPHLMLETENLDYRRRGFDERCLTSVARQEEDVSTPLSCTSHLHTNTDSEYLEYSLENQTSFSTQRQNRNAGDLEGPDELRTALAQLGFTS